MLPPKLDRSYVSEIDQLLYKLNKTIPLSQSQEEAIENDRDIARLRDDPTAIKKTEMI